MIGGEELEQRFRLDGDFEQVTRVFNLGDDVCTLPGSASRSLSARWVRRQGRQGCSPSAPD